ncbi:MAG: EAL domain-containing protein [Polyangiaceae bacterium]|nr:EAL domain-containing protein [Polyangiaceae bacterium]
MSILLVDDRPENLLALEVILEPLGQRLVRASSGEEALAAASKEEFAVILMDVRMPGLDGFETAVQLQRQQRPLRTPIVFISAQPEDHNGLKSYSLGAVDYIPKPIDRNALRSKVSVFVKLRQQQVALEAARAELEARVAERTAELAAANAELEREVVQRKQAEQRLYDRAFRDDLTGLANRALFMIHLSRALTRSRRRPKPTFAVLVLDVDRFKAVNDGLGHLAGDKLLAAFGRRLVESLREVDTVARLGGDEFAVLLDGIEDVRDATRLADRILSELKEPFEIEGRVVSASASIGIAIMSRRYVRAGELVRDADKAMYRAKEAGRSQCNVFDRQMHDSVMAQLQLEEELSRALEHDQMRAYYQPVLRAPGLELFGFEAVLRWIHPERGIVTASEFLASAEETGLIRSVGRWILDQACRTVAAFRKAGPCGLSVSVNVSGTEISRTGFPCDVEAALREAKLDPEALSIEITERTISDAPARVGEAVRALSSLGVGVIIDDFGAGPSRLRDLDSLPISALKLDRVFVSRVTRDGEPLLGAMVALGHKLGKTVIAKAVESSEQLERVIELGCDAVQGHHLSVPLDTPAAQAFTRARSGAFRLRRVGCPFDE